MNKPRDRSSAAGLLPRMEARPWRDGRTISYRFHPVNAKPIHLGTDREAAIRKVLDMNGTSKDLGSFNQLWRLWLETRQYSELADGTRADYAQAWKQLAPVFGTAQAASVRPSDIHRWLRVEREGKPRANHEVALISNLCHLAIARGLIDVNPCVGVPLNPKRPRSRLVTLNELSDFVAWANSQGASATVLVNMAQFSALTGSRRCEFISLEWPDVDEQAGIIRLKRAKQRGQVVTEEIEISQALQELLRVQKADAKFHPDGVVFRAPKSGNAYTEVGFKAMWSKLIAKALAAGIIKQRFTFHDLRAHYTTQHKSRHGKLPEIHANPATTARIYERSRVSKRTSL